MRKHKVRCNIKQTNQLCCNVVSFEKCKKKKKKVNDESIKIIVQEYAHYLSIHLIADNIVLIKNAPQRSFSLPSILYLYKVSTCYQIRIRDYYYFEIIFDKLEKERHQNQNLVMMHRHQMKLYIFLMIKNINHRPNNTPELLLGYYQVEDI